LQQNVTNAGLFLIIIEEEEEEEETNKRGVYS